MMHDAGMTGYHVVVSPAKPFKAGIAHTNAIFSKFPIRSVARHPVERARDIIEVEINVNGRALTLFNNHWKSGASKPELERIRIKNAEVLRARIEERLRVDPQADIIVGGDLNSHYNHDRLYPEIRTGINETLRSQAREGEGLYNLWYELPPEKRYSEVWRGLRGTLMHLILTPGLYDAKGISYVDGSFRVGVIPRVNADALGRPWRWNFAGEQGGGASDHFPLVARFRTTPFEASGPLNRENDAPEEEIPHEVDLEELLDDLPDGRLLKELSENPADFEKDLGAIVGRLFAVKASIAQKRPLRLDVDGQEWPAYAPPHLYKQLKTGAALELVVRFGHWQGQKQLVVEAIR